MQLASVEGINFEGNAQRIILNQGHIDVSYIDKSTVSGQDILTKKSTRLGIGEQGLISIEGGELRYHIAEIGFQLKLRSWVSIDRSINSRGRR